MLFPEGFCGFHLLSVLIQSPKTEVKSKTPSFTAAETLQENTLLGYLASITHLISEQWKKHL